MDLAVLAAAESTTPEMGVEQTLVRDRGVTIDACEVKSVGRELHEQLTGEGVVLGMEIGDCRCQLVRVSTVLQTGQQPADRFDRGRPRLVGEPRSKCTGEPRFVSWRVQPTTPPRRRRVPDPD